MSSDAPLFRSTLEEFREWWQPHLSNLDFTYPRNKPTRVSDTMTRYRCNTSILYQDRKSVSTINLHPSPLFAALDETDDYDFLKQDFFDGAGP